MPYKNFHGCLINPRATNILGTEIRKHNGKPYKVKYARVKGKTTGSTERSYLYPISSWSAGEARAHCKNHGGTFEPVKKD